MTHLHFTLGATPSTWATQDSPPSLTTTDEIPTPLTDLIPTDPANPLFDDTSTTQTRLGPHTTWSLPAPATATLYTLTSAEAETAPTAWLLEGSTDGTTWTTLDNRTNTLFRWPHQTRPFKIQTPAPYQHYRLSLPTPATLTQLELLH
ncbi:hypothetical protein GCM10009804_50420 [Kribbella hippodromi]|uniref:F5/8 type C domain-containing protein n=1 Tax=Kribbella hippodromi TaxID=434347 RepID=A0ABN2DVU2_9ACTN